MRRSNDTHVYLRNVSKETSGLFTCEVTDRTFDTNIRENALKIICKDLPLLLLLFPSVRFSCFRSLVSLLPPSPIIAGQYKTQLSPNYFYNHYSSILSLIQSFQERPRNNWQEGIPFLAFFRSLKEWSDALKAAFNVADTGIEADGRIQTIFLTRRQDRREDQSIFVLLFTNKVILAVI